MEAIVRYIHDTRKLFNEIEFQKSDVVYKFLTNKAFLVKSHKNMSPLKKEKKDFWMLYVLFEIIDMAEVLGNREMDMIASSIFLRLSSIDIPEETFEKFLRAQFGKDQQTPMDQLQQKLFHTEWITVLEDHFNIITEADYCLWAFELNEMLKEEDNPNEDQIKDTLMYVKATSEVSMCIQDE